MNKKTLLLLVIALSLLLNLVFFATGGIYQIACTSGGQHYWGECYIVNKYTRKIWRVHRAEVEEVTIKAKEEAP